MARRKLTLDMDNSSIRLLEVDGRRVVRWGSAGVEPGLINDGVVAQPEALATVLRGLMRATGIAPAPVVVSVAGINSLTRFLSLPVVGGDAGDAVLAQARQILPVSLEELYVAWRPVSVSEGEQHYLLLGVPREVIDSLLLALRAAGLRPRELSLKALALARAIGRPDALIVNVEPASLDVVVMAEGIPRVFHSVARAEDGQSTEERAEAVARDLTLAVDFYHRRYPLAPQMADTPLFLAGSLMADAGFADALLNAVDYPVATLKPPLECPPYLPLGQYAVNLGLALSGVPLPPQEGGAVAVLPVMNLLPRRRPPWYVRPRSGALALGLAVALIGLVGLYQATSAAMGETRLLRQQMELVDLRLEQVRKQNTARGQLERQLAEYLGLTSGRAVITGYLNVLEESRPSGVELASVVFSDKGMLLRVSAATWEQAEAYTEALRETGHFASVSLPGEAGAGEEGKVSFAIEPQFPQDGPRLIE